MDLMLETTSHSTETGAPASFHSVEEVNPSVASYLPDAILEV